MATFPTTGQTSYGPTLQGYIDAVPTDMGYVVAKSHTYGAVGNGTTDDTSHIQAALTAASAGRTVILDAGTYKVTSSLVVPAGVTLHMQPGAVINHTVYNETCIFLNAGSRLVGGQITSPGTWDGTNTGTWDYAVVWVQGDGCQVSGVQFNNVPRAGITIVDVNDVVVTDNRIIGNYPSGQWTGVETQHFGIAYDAPSGAPHGDVVISNNIVRSCVQGFQSGGSGTITASGVSISGNVFESCWNHAIYGYGYGFSVVGNAVNRCGIPVALWGQYHSVTGNTLYTDTTGGSDARDSTGISLRDPFGCVVANNTIRGNGGAGTVIINLTQNSGTDVSHNLVANNTVDVTGAGIAIRVGNGASTCKNNRVIGNTVRGQGTSGQGLITIISSSNSFGNSVEGNTVTMLGETHGIYVSKASTARLAGNYVRLEYNAPSAVTLGALVIASDAGGVNVTNNQVEVTASFGTNITFRGVYEITAGPGGNRIVSNDYSGMDATLATVQPFSLLATGASYVDEVGTGAPTSFKAIPGSRYMNLSGGSATTLYVKESGTGSSGWVGK